MANCPVFPNYGSPALYVIVTLFYLKKQPKKHIGGVMLSILTLIAVDCVFEPRSGQTKDYIIGIYCFSVSKYTALRSKSNKLVGSESE
jgi:hypothetical protein